MRIGELAPALAAGATVLGALPTLLLSFPRKRESSGKQLHDLWLDSRSSADDSDA